MKTNLTLFLCLFTTVLFGQETNNQMFMIHEDQVSPGMMVQYEEAAKTLAGYIKEHNDPKMAYSAGMTDDLNYFYVSPIENYAQIDGMGKQWEGLTATIGEERMNMLWEKFDQCYDVHRNYIVSLNSGLSYTPSGDAMEDGGGNARKWTWIYAHPDHVADMHAVSKKWKEMYEKLELPFGYRVYTGGMGMDIGSMLIVNYGKDVGTIVQNETEVQSKLGEDGYKLWMESAKYIRKMEIKYGTMRPDLAYSPE